jgi:hypothetical protein
VPTPYVGTGQSVGAGDMGGKAEKKMKRLKEGFNKSI